MDSFLAKMACPFSLCLTKLADGSLNGLCKAGSLLYYWRSGLGWLAPLAGWLVGWLWNLSNSLCFVPFQLRLGLGLHDQFPC